MYDSRSVAGGPVSRATASGLERMYSGSPVVDITDVIDSSRSGCSMASVWTIIPPIDRPITCARSTPQASSTASASRAMSDSRYAAPCVVGRGAGERRRQPDVAVVEADHVEPARGEHLAPLVGVVDALAAETVDHQQGRISRIAEGVVVELARAVHGASRVGVSWPLILAAERSPDADPRVVRSGGVASCRCPHIGGSLRMSVVLPNSEPVRCSGRSCGSSCSSSGSGC